MRSRFDEQLAMLNTELIEMGALCEDAIGSAARALTEKNKALIKHTFALEEEIDRKENQIENLCLKLLLKQQPVAKDLRLISSALKMITDMERIGDQARDIAEITGFASNAGLAIEDIKRMADETGKMVTSSIEAFVRRELSLAQKVIASDDVVDGLFNTIKNELIQFINQDIQNGEYAMDMLMIAKYLERIGDHAVNIAEWVEFSITGTHRNDGEAENI